MRCSTGFMARRRAGSAGSVRWQRPAGESLGVRHRSVRRGSRSSPRRWGRPTGRRCSCKVELSAMQRVKGGTRVGIDEADLDVGVVAVKGGDGLRQQRRAHTGESCESQSSAAQGEHGEPAVTQRTCLKGCIEAEKHRRERQAAPETAAIDQRVARRWSALLRSDSAWYLCRAGADTDHQSELAGLRDRVGRERQSPSPAHRIVDDPSCTPDKAIATPHWVRSHALPRKQVWRPGTRSVSRFARGTTRQSEGGGSRAVRAKRDRTLPEYGAGPPLHGNLQSQRSRDWPPRPCERGTDGGAEPRVRPVNAQALGRSQPGRGLVSDLG